MIYNQALVGGLSDTFDPATQIVNPGGIVSFTPQPVSIQVLNDFECPET